MEFQKNHIEKKIQVQQTKDFKSYVANCQCTRTKTNLFTIAMCSYLLLNNDFLVSWDADLNFNKVKHILVQ